jgi:hypothetical protein
MSTFLAASSYVRFRLLLLPDSAPWCSVEFVLICLRPEMRTNSQAFTPSKVIFRMEARLLVPARGPLRLDDLVVGANLWAVPAVVGRGSPNKSDNGQRFTSPTMTSDTAMPSVEVAS